jgi:hypothetical protein
MDISRRELLLQADESSISAEQKDKLRKRLTEEIADGTALLSLKNSKGWKLIVDEFITPNTHISKLLSAPKEKRDEVHARVEVLLELLNFIEQKITQGVRGSDTAEQLKGR